MSDDQDLERYIAESLERLRPVERRAAILRASIAEAMRELEAKGAPAQFKYVNMDIDEAMILFLRDAFLTGASEQEIIDGLRAGGLAWNAKDFEKNVRVSIKASLRNGILLQDGERYVWSKKLPARFKDRHKK